MNDDLDNQNKNTTNLSNERDKRTIFRVRKNKDNPYVQINKTCLNDPSLSLKAKGLLSYLLSKPDDWVVHRSEVLKHCTDGKDSLQTAIHELKNSGYLKIVPEKDKKGIIIGWATNVFESPQTILTLVPITPESDSPILDESSIKKFPESHNFPVSNPESGNPDSGFSRSGESALTNNKNNLKLKNKNNTHDEIKLSNQRNQNLLLADPVVVLFEKLNGLSISKKLFINWVEKYGIKYVDEKIELMKFSKPKNPEAYLNKAISLDWKFSEGSQPKKDEIKTDEIVRYPSHEENVVWYKKLSDDEKSKCLENALFKHYIFANHLEIQNTSVLNKGFTNHNLFKMLMKIIGRAS
jgi:hypothetical protein